MKIHTNVASMHAQRNLSESTSSLENSSKKLSSGMRINSAKDDAAGLTISNNLKAQEMGLKQASRNANDSISILQVAEGGMNEQRNILSRMKELALNASTGTLSDSERIMLNNEYQEISNELDRIAKSTSYNGKQILTSDPDDFHFRDLQIGIHNHEDSRLSIRPPELATDKEALGISNTNLLVDRDAQNSLAYLDKAMEKMSNRQSVVGSYQARLHSSVNLLNEQVLGTATANSKIRDVDYAQETAENVRAKLMMESSSKVMVAANNIGANALKLIG